MKHRLSSSPRRLGAAIAAALLLPLAALAAAVTVADAPATPEPTVQAAEALCVDLSGLNLPSVCMGPLLGSLAASA